MDEAYKEVIGIMKKLKDELSPPSFFSTIEDMRAHGLQVVISAGKGGYICSITTPGRDGEMSPLKMGSGSATYSGGLQSDMFVAVEKVLMIMRDEMLREEGRQEVRAQREGRSDDKTSNK